MKETIREEKIKRKGGGKQEGGKRKERGKRGGIQYPNVGIEPVTYYSAGHVSTIKRWLIQKLWCWGD